MAESLVHALLVVGAVACVIAAIRSKRWLLLLAAIGLLAGGIFLRIGGQ